MQHSNLYKQKWNFPNCIGALDGKHIGMVAPPNSASTYYNYEGYFSIVLMALADANYKITYMDVGCKGRVADGGVFSQCTLADALARNTLNIPSEKPLTQNGKPVPHVIVADDAFPLTTRIMKPYPYRNLSGPERVYNYRLSRARRIVENVFGIMSARFRILLKMIHLDEEKTSKIVLAICALHNFLMTISNKYATPSDFDCEIDEGVVIPGKWRAEVINNLLPLKTNQQKNAATDAKTIQNIFKEYFVSAEGEVSWQYQHI